MYPSAVTPSPDPQLLAALLQSLPMRVVLIDRQHRYAFANPAALDYLRLRPEQMVGRTIEEVRGPRIFQSYLQVAEKLFSGEAQHWEGWTDYPVHGRRYMEEWLTPYPADGQPVQVVMGWGWLAISGPAFMYLLLVYASGLPPLEAHMLRSRGDAFRDYQARVRAFWPLPKSPTVNSPVKERQ